MTNEVDYWKSFWGDKTDPLHSYSNKKYYKNYGKELSVLLPSDNIESILDLGCGTGALFEPLGFHKAKNYIGVDLSKSMLDIFHSSHPDVTLVEDSAHIYKDNNKYDLVFTNGVVQYLTADMLRKQISNALGMLTENGIIIHSSVLWSIHKFNFNTRRLTPPYSFALRPAIGSLLTTFKIKKDNMGIWYSPNEIINIASEFNLIAEFHGSMYYPYRFHVTLTKQS